MNEPTTMSARRLTISGSPQEAVVLLRDLLSRSPGPSSPEVLTELTFAEVFACDFTGCRDTGRTALGRATNPSEKALAAAAYALAVSMGSPTAALPLSAIEEALNHSVRLLPEAEDALAAYLVAEAAMSNGQLALAEETAQDAKDPDPYTALMLQQVRARSLVFQGRFAEAAAVTNGLRHGATALDVCCLVALAAGIDAFLAAQSGDRGLVQRNVKAACEGGRPADQSYAMSGALVLAAYATSALLEHEQASALLLEAAGGPSLPRLKWVDRAYGYELLATAAVAQSRLAEAREWLNKAQAMERSGMTAAAVERTAALVEEAYGDSAAGADAGRRARSLASDRGGHLDATRAHVLQATALARAGERKHALVELEAVVRTAAALGAGGVRSQAIREMRRMGRRYRETTGWDSLTDREQHVARLAGLGLTNRDIASDLVVSERTVQTHLEAALRALGLSSRTMLPVALAGLAENTPAEDHAATATGLPPLTPRQSEVVKLVTQGLSNAEIGTSLGLSVKTVEKHLSDVFRRWDVSSRTAAAALAQAEYT